MSLCIHAPSKRENESSLTVGSVQIVKISGKARKTNMEKSRPPTLSKPTEWSGQRRSASAAIAKDFRSKGQDFQVIKRNAARSTQKKATVNFKSFGTSAETATPRNPGGPVFKDKSRRWRPA